MHGPYIYVNKRLLYTMPMVRLTIDTLWVLERACLCTDGYAGLYHLWMS